MLPDERLKLAHELDVPVELEVGVDSLLEGDRAQRSEEHTSELQSQSNLVCRLLLEKKKKKRRDHPGELIPIKTVHTRTHGTHQPPSGRRHATTSAMCPPAWQDTCGHPTTNRRQRYD